MADPLLGRGRDHRRTGAAPVPRGPDRVPGRRHTAHRRAGTAARQFPGRLHRGLRPRRALRRRTPRRPHRPNRSARRHPARRLPVEGPPVETAGPPPGLSSATRSRTGGSPCAAASFPAPRTASATRRCAARCTIRRCSGGGGRGRAREHRVHRAAAPRLPGHSRPGGPHRVRRTGGPAPREREWIGARTDHGRHRSEDHPEMTTPKRTSPAVPADPPTTAAPSPASAGSPSPCTSPTRANCPGSRHSCAASC